MRNWKGLHQSAMRNWKRLHQSALSTMFGGHKASKAPLRELSLKYKSQIVSAVKMGRQLLRQRDIFLP
jgi:hypothetical protein